MQTEFRQKIAWGLNDPHAGAIEAVRYFLSIARLFELNFDLQLSRMSHQLLIMVCTVAVTE
jgi:hypothetical protein